MFQYGSRLAHGFIPRPRIGAYWHRSGEERLCIVRAGGRRGVDGGPLQAEVVGGSGCTACGLPVSNVAIQSPLQVPGV